MQAPNKRLKLAGGDRFKEAECCALAGTDCRPLLLRRRASRPQLKRDPLGSRFHMVRLKSSVGLIALLSFCRHPGRELARELFAIPSSVAVDSISVRNAILTLLAPGTPEAEVVHRLADRGIGRDRRSQYIAPDSRGLAVVQITFNAAGTGPVRHAFAIGLWFDAGRRLDSIEVHEWPNKQ